MTLEPKPLHALSPLGKFKGLEGGGRGWGGGAVVDTLEFT